MWKWAFVLVCSFGVGSDAHAVFSVYSEIQGQVVLTGGVFSMTDTFDQTLFANSFPDALSKQAMIDYAGLGLGSSSASVSATFGALSGSSSASDTENHETYPQAVASGIASAEVYDTLHLSSASLPSGTPVTLHFALNLTSNAPAPSGGQSSYATAHASLDAHPETPGTAVHLEFGNYDPPILELSGTLEAYVDQYVALTYDLYTHSYVIAGAVPIGESAGLSIRPRIFVDAANPDVTMTTDSGFDYGVPVPEPTSATSAGVAALLGLAWRASRCAGGVRRRP